eukprot:GHRR01025808.1.p1 GENE.GHRR01025808.1~~GHRR01025808.1.p1  ORF type:complete len:137 (+),score=45.48 GHRR01025808.1:950-1360(+)
MSGLGHLQSALSKERRELQQQQQRTLLEAIPKDLSRPWEDPMPEDGERHLAAELRGLGMTATNEAPEWKVKALGKAPTFGIKDSRSILEQRQSLPIYKLKKELIQAVLDNQVRLERQLGAHVVISHSVLADNSAPA